MGKYLESCVALSNNEDTSGALGRCWGCSGAWPGLSDRPGAL